MLIRNMQWPPTQFSELSDDGQVSFWQTCKETVDAGGRFTYSRIRATLVKTLATRKVVERCSKEFSVPKPLEVWSRAGYDAAMIEKNGDKEWNPVVGWVYHVPQKETSLSVTLQEVEEHLTRAEQGIKGKKGTQIELEESEDEDNTNASAEPMKKKEDVNIFVVGERGSQGCSRAQETQFMHSDPCQQGGSFVERRCSRVDKSTRVHPG